MRDPKGSMRFLLVFNTRNVANDPSGTGHASPERLSRVTDFFDVVRSDEIGVVGIFFGVGSEKGSGRCLLI